MARKRNEAETPLESIENDIENEQINNEVETIENESDAQPEINVNPIQVKEVDLSEQVLQKIKQKENKLHNENKKIIKDDSDLVESESESTFSASEIILGVCVTVFFTATLYLFAKNKAKTNQTTQNTPLSVSSASDSNSDSIINRLIYGN